MRPLRGFHGRVGPIRSRQRADSSRRRRAATPGACANCSLEPLRQRLIGPTASTIKCSKDKSARGRGNVETDRMRNRVLYGAHQATEDRQYQTEGGLIRRWTLRRDTASNGLAAVRRAARQSKTVRFTALLHHITTDLLKQSYLRSREMLRPGPME